MASPSIIEGSRGWTGLDIGSGGDIEDQRERRSICLREVGVEGISTLTTRYVRDELLEADLDDHPSPSSPLRQRRLNFQFLTPSFDFLTKGI